LKIKSLGILEIKTRLLVRKRVRFIESKQPIRRYDGTEAYENRTNSSWRNYILIVVETRLIVFLLIG